MEQPPIFAPHVEQLSTLLRGPDPILVVPEPDDDYMHSVLQRAVAQWGTERGVIDTLDSALCWTRIADGHRRPRPDPVDLETFIGDFATQHKAAGAGRRPPRASVLWLRDLSDALRAPRAFGRLKALASEALGSRAHLRVLLTGQDATAPPGLPHLTRIEALDRPPRDSEEYRAFISAVLAHAGASIGDERDLDALADRVRGLEASSIRRLVARAAASSPQDVLRRIKAERDRMLDTGVIEVREVHDPKLGGLDALQAHLDNVADLLSDYHAQPSDRLLELLPRGMLLLGPPGCGKSLAAEVAAKKLGVPLLQLHASRLMDRYLGGSEERLESALATARAAAPCVLWIDEMEKAVGGLGPSSEGGGTGSRMLGRLLSWMQDNRHGVYVVATANSISHVPPELLRRGRFDDHFVLALPTPNERREILRIELVRRGAELTEDEISHFARRLDEFSGADLAALVRDACRIARLRDSADSPSLAHLEYATTGFEPQARQWPEELERMRAAVEKHSFRKATSESGDARGLRERRDSDRTLPHRLRRLVYSGEALILDWGSAVGQLLELTTKDGRRVARLGSGDERGVHSEAGRYDVQQHGSSIRLVLIDGDESMTMPRRLELTDSEGGVRVWFDGMAAAAKVRRVRHERSVHPTLWPALGAESYSLEIRRMPDVGDVTLEFCDNDGVRWALLEGPAGVSAEYEVCLEGPALLLEPRFADHEKLRTHAIRIVGTDTGMASTFPPFEGEVRPLEDHDEGQSMPSALGANHIIIVFDYHGRAQRLELEPPTTTAILNVKQTGAEFRASTWREQQDGAGNRITLTQWQSVGTSSFVPPRRLVVLWQGRRMTLRSVITIEVESASSALATERIIAEITYLS